MNQDFCEVGLIYHDELHPLIRKMMFLLSTLKLLYALNPNLQLFTGSNDENMSNMKAGRKKREEDKLVYSAHILSTLFGRAFNLFTSVKSPRKVLKALS